MQRGSYYQFGRLIEVIVNLTAAIEQQTKALGPAGDPRHTRAADAETELVNEAAMASILDISRRTLAHHRLNGRFPACWVKNGRRILWHVVATTDAWRNGIA